MNAPALKWKRAIGMGENSGSGHRNGIKVFEYFWDCTKNQKGPWRLTCSLPGIKKDIGNFETEEEMKSISEAAFKHFCKRMNLTIIVDDLAEQLTEDKE